MAKEVDVITEIIIQAPVHEVAGFACNPDHAPDWYVNIRSVEWKSEKPLREGSLVAFKAKFLGRELAYTYTFVKLVPDELLIMETAEGPFPMQTTYTFKKEGEQATRMQLRNKGVPSGFSKLFAPLMASMMRKANNKDLQKLKSIMEKKGK